MMLCSLLFLLSGAFTQEPAAEAPRLVAALEKLKDADEEGFDELADQLLKLGEKALDAIDAALPLAKGAPQFRLIRVRDMLWNPIHIKGAYVSERGNRERDDSTALGDIYLSFNGQSITDNQHYSQLLAEAEKAGLKQAVIEIIHQGRRKQVVVPGLRMGGYIRSYPHALAHYVHHGHRSQAWDEDAKSILDITQPNRIDKKLERLLRAVDAGCRDTRILNECLESLCMVGRYDEALTYWALAEKEALRTRYGGWPWRACLYSAARAFLSTGRREEARKTAEEGRALAAQFEEHRYLGLFDILLAAYYEDENINEAARRANAAWATLSSSGIHMCWTHDAVSHVLRRAGQFEELARKAPSFGSDRTHSPSAKFDQFDMPLRFKGGTMTLVPPERLFPNEESLRMNRWGGLQGAYHAGTRFEGEARTRIDPGIEFYWGDGAPVPGLPKDDFSIRWTGFVLPEFSESYTFTVRVDDGIRLWVDNKLIIDRWHGQIPTYHSGKIDLEAGKPVPLRVEYFEVNQGAGVQLYWECPSFSNRQITRPWTLVYRNSFEVPDLASAIQDAPPARFKRSLEAREGRLQGAAQAPYSTEIGSSWGAYSSVRVEALIRLPGHREGRACTAGLRACLGRAARSEVGSSLSWPRDLLHYFFLDSYGRVTAVWGHDLAVPRRFTLEVHRGRASTMIDGKELEFQTFPPHWSGTVGLRASGDFEIDNYEIWVPSERPSQADEVRAHYDRAYAALKDRRLPEGLEALEQAALLQPRHEELAALYAAALAGDRDLLDARLALAASPRVARLLIEAETHLGLFEGDSDLEEAVRSVRSSLHDGRVPSDNALETLREAAKPGTLALAAQALHHAYDRGLEVSANRVDAAYFTLLKGDPRTIAGRVRYVRFLQSCGREGEAVPLFKEIARRIPRTDVLKKGAED